MFDDICDSVYQGVDTVCFKNGKELHYKRLDYINSVSAKDIGNGFTFKSIKEGKKVISYEYNIVQCVNKK